MFLLGGGETDRIHNRGDIALCFPKKSWPEKRDLFLTAKAHGRRHETGDRKQTFLIPAAWKRRMRDRQRKAVFLFAIAELFFLNPDPVHGAPTVSVVQNVKSCP